jgi:DNA-binding response OmpR family regulator
MAATTILLMEDDSQIAKSLSMGLGLAGFEVTLAGTVAEAWALLTDRAFDVLLFDVNLPDGSGIALCQRLREAGKSAPILFLSAKTDEETVVKGITVGGDDYLRKPFGIEELKARIGKLLRRSNIPGKVIELGQLNIDLDKRAAALGRTVLTLGRREFDILAILAKKAGDVVTREHILSALDEKSDVYDRTIDSHISHLRRKLKAAGGDGVQIIPVYGVGYRLHWETPR